MISIRDILLHKALLFLFISLMKITFEKEMCNRFTDNTPLIMLLFVCNLRPSVINS